MTAPPPTDPQPSSPPHSAERLVFFTDAVVAIAITLLVLSLIEAVHGAGQEAPTTARFLAEHAWELGAFVLSFVVIAALWRAHHALFERIRSYDAVIMHVNFVWLLAIVLLPLSTGLIAVYGSERSTLAFYIGNVTLGSVCLCVMAARVWRAPALARPGLEVDPQAFGGFATASLLTLAALIVAVAVPAVGYYALLLLLLQRPLSPLVVRLIRRAR